MKCPNCGAQIGKFDSETYTCKYCRSTFHASEFDPGWNQDQDTPNVSEIHHYHHQESQDKLSVGMGCLCFFFPLGWIIYFLYRDSSPRKARAAMIIAAVLTVLFLIGIALGDGPGK